MTQVALVVKSPPASAGDVGLIPGLGRSPGGGQGNPLQWAPGESHRQRRLAGAHGVAKSQTRLKRLSTHACMTPEPMQDGKVVPQGWKVTVAFSSCHALEAEAPLGPNNS